MGNSAIMKKLFATILYCLISMYVTLVVSFAECCIVVANKYRHLSSQPCQEEALWGTAGNSLLMKRCANHNLNQDKIIQQTSLATPLLRNILVQPRNFPKFLQTSRRAVIRTLSGGIIFVSVESSARRHFCAQSALFSI